MSETASKGSKKPKRPLWFRTLRATGVAFVSLWLIYILAANVFFAFFFERVVDQDPTSVDIHFKSGWTIFPGHVHAKGLSIRGRDSSIEWMLRIDTVVFDVSLIGLPKKHFFVSRVEGDGISFRLRRNLDAPPASLEEIADHPPIEGFPLGYWLRPSVESEDKWSDAAWNLWTIRLENVKAHHINEVWFDNERLEGNVDVAGRFYLRPLRAVNVGPLHVTIESSQVSEGLRKLQIDRLAGTVNAQIDQFDPRVTKGLSMLRQVSAATDLRVRIPDVGILPLPKVKLTGELDVRELVLDMKRGVIQNGTHANVGPNPIALTLDEHRVTTDLSASAHTVAGTLSFRALATEAKLHRDGLVAGAPHMIVDGDTRALDLTDPFGDLHLVASARSAEVPRISVLNAYIPKHTRFAIHDGAATVDADGEVWFAKKQIAGHASVHGRDVDLSIDKVRVRTGLDVQTSLARSSWEDELKIERADGVFTNLTLFNGSVAAVTATKLTTYLTDFVPQNPLSNLTFEAALEGGRVRNSVALSDFMSKDRTIDIAAPECVFSLNAKAVIDNSVASGTTHFRASKVGIVTKKFRASGDVLANVNFADLRKTRLRIVDSELVVTKVDAGLKTRDTAVALDRILLRARSKGLDFAHPRLRDLDLRLIVDNGTVSDVRALTALMKEGSFVIEKGSARFAADIELLGSKGTSKGALYASISHGGFSLHETRIDGDYSLFAEIRGFDRNKSALDISGSRLRIRNVDVSHASAETKQWFGDLILDRAAVRFDGVPSFDAAVRLEARDATPFLALAMRYDLPEPFVPYTRMPKFQATARLTLGSKEVALRDLAADGGNLSMAGLYGSRGGQRRGAFVIGFGPLSAGLRIDNEGSHLRFFGLDGWLRSERAAVMQLLAVSPR